MPPETGLFTIGYDFTKIAMAEVPSRIKPEHINQLLGLSGSGYRKPRFEIRPRPGKRTFDPSGLKFVTNLDDNNHNCADVFHVYWFFLRQKRESPPDSFCARTAAQETPLFLFAGIPVKSLIHGGTGSVYPYMLFHSPKMGRGPRNFWKFGHVEVGALASNPVFFRNVRFVLQG